jgi:hypothetical protein
VLEASSCSRQNSDCFFRTLPFDSTAPAALPSALTSLVDRGPSSASYAGRSSLANRDSAIGADGAASARLVVHLTCCPRAALSFWAVVRPMMPVAPPAGKGMNMPSDLAGQAWAGALSERAAVTDAAKIKVNVRPRGVLPVCVRRALGRAACPARSSVRRRQEAAKDGNGRTYELQALRGVSRCGMLKSGKRMLARQNLASMPVGAEQVASLAAAPG